MLPAWQSHGVSMETEAGPWRPRGVTMETGPGLRLPSPSSLLPPSPAEPPREAGAGATAAAARWDPRRHSLLIVIGDIGTESQLRAVRAHLEQGEPLSWLCSGHPPPPRASPPAALISQSVRLHSPSLPCNSRNPRVLFISIISPCHLHLPCHASSHLPTSCFPILPHTPWHSSISLSRG